MSANDFITGRSLPLPTCQFCYWPNYHQPIMLKVWLAWLWWRRVWPVLPWLCIIWLVDLTCKCHEREFCTRSFKITELEKGRWSWISNCGEAFHTDSWLAEANPGHSDRDVILQALLPGPSTVVLFGPGKARMLEAGKQPDSWLPPQNIYTHISMRGRDRQKDRQTDSDTERERDGQQGSEADNEWQSKSERHREQGERQTQMYREQESETAWHRARQWQTDREKDRVKKPTR